MPRPTQITGKPPSQYATRLDVPKVRPGAKRQFTRSNTAQLGEGKPEVQWGLGKPREGVRLGLGRATEARGEASDSKRCNQRLGLVQINGARPEGRAPPARSAGSSETEVARVRKGSPGGGQRRVPTLRAELNRGKLYSEWSIPVKCHANGR